MNYVVITENDISAWKDKTGELYHFPKKYLKFLSNRAKVIYYKGKLRSEDKREFAHKRLTHLPHYFATAEIERVYQDENSTKNDYFAVITKFQPFTTAVNAKVNEQFLESIPKNKISNYWRDAVRPISEETYRLIISLQTSSVSMYNDISASYDYGFESLYEGNPKKVFSTVYERNPVLRQQAISIHGYSCQACNFNFKHTYGEWGEGFIHVHHLKPLSRVGEQVKIDPKKDLVVLCANCHAMVHRKRSVTLTMEMLKKLINHDR